MIPFTCPKCGSTAELADEVVGSTYTCPHCGNVSVVPSPPPAQGPGGPPAGSAPAPLNEHDARMWATFCHLAALAGFVFPFGNIIAPLIIWLILKDRSELVNDQGREALNFQITMAIAAVVSFVLVFVFIGFLLLAVVTVLDVVFIILAAVKAQTGQRYRYPLCIRFIR